MVHAGWWGQKYLVKFLFYINYKKRSQIILNENLCTELHFRKRNTGISTSTEEVNNILSQGRTPYFENRGKFNNTSDSIQSEVEEHLPYFNENIINFQ